MQSFSLLSHHHKSRLLTIFLGATQRPERHKTRLGPLCNASPRCRVLPEHICVPDEDKIRNFLHIERPRMHVSLISAAHNLPVLAGTET